MKYKKKTIKSILSMILSFSMILSSVLTTAWTVNAVNAIVGEKSEYGIVGSMTGWGMYDDFPMYETETGIFVGSIGIVPSGEYAFEVRKDGSWEEVWSEYSEYDDKTKNNQTTISVYLDEKAELLVKLDTTIYEEKLWAVSYAIITESDIEPNWIYTGKEQIDKKSPYGIVGNMTGWGMYDDFPMYETETGIFVGSIGIVPSGEYVFEVRKDGSWEEIWSEYSEYDDRTKNNQTTISVYLDEKTELLVKLDTTVYEENLWAVSYKIGDGKWVYTGKTVEKEPVSEEPELQDYYITQISDYIYFDNSGTQWDKVYAYWWNGLYGEYWRTYDLLNNDWGCERVLDSETDMQIWQPIAYPGTKMTQIEGTDIWQIRIPFNAERIIFNDGKSDEQIFNSEISYVTKDIDFDAIVNAGQIYTTDLSFEPKQGRGIQKTKYTYENGEWLDYRGYYNSEKIGGESEEPYETDKSYSKHFVGVVGSFNDWDNDIQLMDDDGDGVYEGVVYISKVTENMIIPWYIDDEPTGKYYLQFRVRLDNEWTDTWGYYEPLNDRTFNSQSSVPVKEATVGKPLQFKVIFDTNNPAPAALENPDSYAEPGNDDFNYLNVYYELMDVSLNHSDFEYHVNDDDTITIISYNDSGEENVVIPNTIDGKVVTSVGYYAFLNCTGLTGVTIPNSVTTIGSGAFSGCTGLMSITIPDSVTNIEGLAFYHCYSLTSIEIPDSVTVIDKSAFLECTGLTSINVSKDNSVYSSVDGVLFSKDKTSIISFPGGKKGSYTILNSVTTIGLSAFEYCKNLTGVKIPNSVTTINPYAFKDCTNLTSIEIPDSVILVGEEAFDNTAWYSNQSNGLVYVGKVAYKYKGNMPENTSIQLKNGTVSIGYGAFSGCGNLMNIVIPNTVTMIDNVAFSDCTSLTSIKIPKNVKSIGYYAFDNCTALKNIEIPDSVISVGGNAFKNTAWYDSQPDGLIYVGRVAYEYKGTMPENTSIALKDGTVSISAWAFYWGCEGLISVEIPDSVREIDFFAFKGCSNLKSVEIPDSVTYIGTCAFGYSDKAGDDMTMTDNFIIYGVSGSAAEIYANENNIPFKPLIEITDDETQVTITGIIDSDVTLKVDKISVEGISIDEENKAVRACFDISLMKNENEVQPEMPVTVKIPYSSSFKNIEVYRINDDGTKDKMFSSYDGEYITFVTEHFSKYAIVTNTEIMGDTNGDGKATIADSLMIARYEVKLRTLTDEQLAVSDVNYDGKVTIADALKIARYEVKLINKL